MYICNALEIYLDPTNHEVMDSYFSLMCEYLQMSWKKSGRRNRGFLFTFLLVWVCKNKEVRPRSEEVKDPAQTILERPHAISWFITTTFEGKFIFSSKLVSWQFSGWFSVVWHQSEPNTSQFNECNHFASFLSDISRVYSINIIHTNIHHSYIKLTTKTKPKAFRASGILGTYFEIKNYDSVIKNYDSIIKNYDFVIRNYACFSIMARMSSTSSLEPRKIGERTWSPVGSISKIGLVPSVAFPPAFSTMYAWNVYISKLVLRFSKNFSIQILFQKLNQIVDIYQK